MNSFIRRKLPGVLTGGAMVGAGDASEDPLLLEASQWVDRQRGCGTTILVHPVLRLQREFRLGYARACALADHLAQRGEWTVDYDEGGTRYACIHRLT